MDFVQHFPFLCKALLGMTFLLPENELNNILRRGLNDFEMNTLRVLKENQIHTVYVQKEACKILRL